jgi:hypothetical protein
MRCFRRAPNQAHQLLASVLLPTTRKGRGPPKNELHLGHAVAKRHYFHIYGMWVSELVGLLRR